MKWIKVFAVLVLTCLMLAACGSGKPSQKQMESDLQMSGIVQFPIEKVEITESHGDKSDYYARVRLSGSEDLFSYSANGYAKYRKSDGRWILADCDLSSDVKATIKQVPTEQEILNGFGGLKPLEFYLPHSYYYTAKDLVDTERSNGLSFESQFGNFAFSEITMDDRDSGVSISFGVTCDETYHGVSAVESFHMQYIYDANDNGWIIWGSAECADVDYSGLVGRTVRNHEMDGYIDSFSADGFTLVIDGETYGFSVAEEYRDITSQFEHLRWRDIPFLGSDTIRYVPSYNDLYSEEHGAYVSQAWFSLQDMTIRLDQSSFSMNSLGLYPLEISE